MATSIMQHFSRFLLWAGVGFLIYAGGTMLYAGVYQQYELWKFDQELAPPSTFDTAALEKNVELHEGDVVGKLEVPRIGISVMVFQGTEENTLTVGAGHVPGTPLPGGDGNVAIAAHRDTYFRKLEGIRSGDNIEVSTLHRGYNYIVDSTEIVDPDDTRVIESRPQRELTLITCFPFHFVGPAPRRFIVHARPAP